KVTPLMVVAALAAGAYAVITTPKEDEPTIVVPLVEVLVPYPAAGSAEVDERAARPVAALMREIPTVAHVYSAAATDGAMISVEFKAGVNAEHALVQVNDRLEANPAISQPARLAPLVRPRGSQEVPILVLTLWSERDDPYILRRLAVEVAGRLEHIEGLAGTDVIGGPGREITVEADPARLAGKGVSPARVAQIIQAANLQLPAGDLRGPEGVQRVQAGAFLRGAEDVGSLVVGATAAGPVYLRDVATVRDGPAPPDGYLLHRSPATGGAQRLAVDLAVRKVVGKNAINVTKAVIARVAGLRGTLIPSDVHVEVIRNAGEVATQKVESLFEHLLIATLIVSGIIALALGRREAAIIGFVIPIIVGLVVVVYSLTGYTLNRLSLAALIFAIGILVDDGIVVIENIHRHFQLGDEKPLDAALHAVSEVGNPTIIANLCVIAALLPMMFLSGLVGQWARGLPYGSIVSMVFSLAVTLSITPYLAYRLLKRGARPSAGIHQDGAASGATLAKAYVTVVRPFLDHPRQRRRLYAVAVLLLIGSLGLIATRTALVQLMSHADEDEFSVMVDLPEGANLETTTAAAGDAVAYLMTVPEVTGYQIYAGAPGPLSYQGLARSYGTRTRSHQAEILVKLRPAADRRHENHELAVAVRPGLSRAFRPYGARYTVVEPPVGPPAMASVAAEIYGPDYAGQVALAEQVRGIFSHAPYVADVAMSADSGDREVSLVVDYQKAAVRGVMAAELAQAVRAAVGDAPVGYARIPDETDPVPIVVRLPEARRASAADLTALFVTGAGGQIPLADLVHVRHGRVAPPIVRKDLMPVVYVTAEPVGPRTASIYVALDLGKQIRELRAPDGSAPRLSWTGAPKSPDRYTVAWGGDYSSTYETLSELNAAFVAVLILIYVLLAGWFGSFTLPLVIMLPIPFTLVGVLPAHVLTRQFVSGTAIIGVLMLAGILVRNSVLLIDFIENAIARGLPLREAVLEAGGVRVRPILLTASAVVFGESVLLLDPVMRGLGLTLMSGAAVGTALTLVLVPVVYYELRTGLQRFDARRAAGRPKAAPAGP
ncbi:MAG: efflux RND transporter permease subunit, partial [Gemmatimonadales bacterium]